jgi:hypothetical protein
LRNKKTPLHECGLHVQAVAAGLFVFDFYDGLAIVRPALGANMMRDMICAACLALDEMLQSDDIL